MQAALRRTASAKRGPSLRRQVAALARKAGATVEVNTDNEHSLDVGISAPPGFRFQAGPHEVIGAVEFPREPAPRGTGARTNADLVWRGLLSDLEEGFDRCDEPHCDWCGKGSP